MAPVLATIVALTNLMGTVEIDTRGARVTSYAPVGGSEVFFRSETGTGGMPLCWPWFADRGPAGSKRHGLVRDRVFKVVGNKRHASWDRELTLRLESDEETRKVFPHDFALTVSIRLNDRLTVTMTGENTGTDPFEVSEAFHPYFAVADSAQCRVDGTDTSEYRLTDPVTGCVLSFSDEGGADRRVWRPNAKSHLSKSVTPITPDDWRHFVCVENGTLTSPSYILKPGEKHVLKRTIRLSLTHANAKPIDLQPQIDAAAAAGGGRVVVPPGEWLSKKAIQLRSNVELHLADGATLTFPDDPEACLPPVRTSFSAIEYYGLSPLVRAYGATNVAVTGRGTIAPRMALWREWFNRDRPDAFEGMRQLYEWGESDTPVEERRFKDLIAARLRPCCVEFERCRNVRLEDFRIRESPLWCVHLRLCEDVTVRGLDIHARGHNNDGIDINASRNVLIENCTLDQGDDGFVIKSGRDRDGRRVGVPCENVEIRNCVIRDGHTLLGVGSEVAGGVRNISLHDCRVEGNILSSVVKLKTSDRKGAYIENIVVSNVVVSGTVGEIASVYTDIDYQWGKYPPREHLLTRIDGFLVENVKAQSAKRVYHIRGDARLPAKNIRLKNIHVKSSAKPSTAENAELSVEDCDNLSSARPAVPAAFAAKDFGDFYTRAWYMVVDNPGPAKSLSWRVFDVCGPAEHHNNVEKNPAFTIRRETAVRRVDTPWMEVNFHTNRPISVIRIRPSRKPGEEFDLYGARIFLLDKNRKIVWHHRIWNTDGQVDYDASAEFSDRDMLGQTLPEYKELGNRVSAPLPPPPKDMRLHIVKHLFNPEAMKRAINAYAVKYPSLFPDKAELLSELATLASGGTRSCASEDAGNAAAIDALSKKVFLRLPAFSRFSDFLAIRRGDGNAMGLPQNWQGNTSVPVSGYSNALVRVSLAKDASTAERTLFESDSFVGDVALDWNLEKVAFSTRKLAEAATGRRAPRNGAHGGIGESGWCVAEMDLAAPGRLREITPTDTPDIDYYDPMYLPDGKMFLMGTVGFQGVPCVGGADHVGNLMLRHVDGRLRRLSFDQDNNWHPVMLPNGRCLYLRWEYTDSAHYFARILMTMNPDGSDQQEFYGSNSYWPNAMFYAKPIPGSSTKFMAVVTGHHGVSRKGELVLFDVVRGRRETAGAVQKLPGWGKPVENVTADRLVNDARQFFLHPYPLSDEGALVAMQDYSCAKHFFIAYVDVFDNQYPLLVSSDDSVNYLEPLPVEKREKPFEVAQRVDESKKTAVVNIVSVYDGPGLAGVPKGVVKKLRLFNYEYCSYRNHGKDCGGHYCIGMEGPWDVRVMLGEVDVEEDGSVLFECPANVPIAIQPLDAEGKHLQEMRSWFAAMPGETLSCLGCHQDQNAAPPAGTRTKASRKAPQKIQPWYGPRRGFAFARETLNVIERRCSGCHDGNPAKKNAIGQPIPNFAGSPRAVYDALHPYVRRNGPEGDYHLLTPGEFHADTSEVWQRLAVGHHGVRLSKEERDRILAWMNMNVPFFGSWTETGEPDPEIIKRRRQLARQVANDTFDPEKVVNPYKKAAFKAPKAEDAARDRRAAAFDPLAGVRAGAPAQSGDQSLDLGNGSRIVLKSVPGSSAFKPFLLAETEITVAQYRAFDPSFDNGVYDMHYKDQVKRGYYMNDDPVFGTPGAVNFPAVRISYEKAEAFCRWLSAKTGREVRLPTEAEWLWAARAGAATPFAWGGFDADFAPYANLADVTRRELAVDGINPKPVPNPSAALDWELKDTRFDDGVLHLAKAGSYRANAWGLKDMVGNAAEWTATDVRFTDGVARKVVCGGSFNDRPHRALMRWGYPTWMRPFDVGFRVLVMPNDGAARVRAN